MSMFTFVAALHNWTVSLKLFVSVIINDMEIDSADLQRTNVGDMKKMTIMLIPQIYN